MSRQMRFSEAISAVKYNLDIVDVVGRYVSLRKTGRSYTGLCPFHQEKSPSFNVHPEKQMYKCFGCGEGGDALSFLMKQENKTFGEIILELAEEQGIEILQEGRENRPARDELDIVYELHTLARDFYQGQLQSSAEAMAYLYDRGVDAQWQNHFGLGFAPPGWENLTQRLGAHLDTLQKPRMLLEKAGLANIRTEGQGFYDRFRNRLIIPIHDDRGRVVAFGGRSLAPDDVPKYLNSPETPIYVKSRILYGLHQARESIRQSGYAILMEGYFDVISAHMAGVTQAVGVCGTALTESHLKLLQRTGAQTLYLCFDSDEAGQTAALRAIELIETHLLDQGIGLHIIQLPGDKDPDDFLQHQGRDAFMHHLESSVDFLTFKFNRALQGITDLHLPTGRIRAVQVLTPILAKIRQPVIRHEHIKLLAERLNLAEETLLLEVKRLEQQNPAYQNKKNYASEAISYYPERYKGRKSGRRDNWKPFRAEDISVFRSQLAPKLPLEEKENLLLSYMLLTPESYERVMDHLNRLTLQSPQAAAFLEAVKRQAGRWQTLEELIGLLTIDFHEKEDHNLIQYLANRAMSLDSLLQSYEGLHGGLKSFGPGEKLKRDIDDLVSRISMLRHKADLTHLAMDGKQHEQEEDDQSALEIQMQLRERLKGQRQRQSPDVPPMQPQPVLEPLNQGV